MKIRRFISGLLLGLGCAITFIGLLALFLPNVNNDQLQLVITSFRTPSDNGFVNVINQIMTFAMDNCEAFILGGAVMVFLGSVLFSLFSRDVPGEEPEHHSRSQKPAPAGEAVQHNWEKPVPIRPNPFADSALWEAKNSRPEPASVESVFTRTAKPEPEPEPDTADQPDEPSVPVPDEAPVSVDVPAPAEPAEEPAEAAEAVETPEAAAEPEPAKPEEPIHMSFARPLPAREMPEANPAPKPEPVYTPNEEDEAPKQLSSRIRSTMGKHTNR